MPLSVAVAGASGYAGGELLRLLAEHPDFDVQTVTAHSNAGQPLIALQPHLRSLAHLTLVETTAENLAGHDVVFLGAAARQVRARSRPQLDDDALVVDCGADHRLTDEAAWQRFYGGEYHGSWPYGLPELAARGRGRTPARRASSAHAASRCPAATSPPSRWPWRPASAPGVVEADRPRRASSRSAPRAPARPCARTCSPARSSGSASAYGVGGTHRHVPEIQQNLRAAGATDVSISFTPVLVPMSRGILATSTATPRRRASARTTCAPRGSTPTRTSRSSTSCPRAQFPRTADTVGANTALHRPRRRRGRRAASSSSAPSTTSSRAPPARPSSPPTSPSASPRRPASP